MEEEEVGQPDRVASASFTSRTAAGDSAPIHTADGTAGLPRSSAGSAVSAALPAAAPPPPSVVSMDAASGALASFGLPDVIGAAASVGGPVSDAGAPPELPRCLHALFRTAALPAACLWPAPLKLCCPVRPLHNRMGLSLV